jgi:hypothetical protein
MLAAPLPKSPAVKMFSPRLPVQVWALIWRAYSNNVAVKRIKRRFMEYNSDGKVVYAVREG